ncbi:predicted protein [Eggerthella sp. CAG:298]|nr:predicted protein [Eggerthella sp. CAG:298]
MGNITRRQLITKGAMATAGLLLIPSISFADTLKEEQASSSMIGPSFRCTVSTTDGEVLLENGSKNGASVMSIQDSSFFLEDALTIKSNSDGSVTNTYEAALAKRTISSGVQLQNTGSDENNQVAGRVVIAITYDISNGKIKISKAVGTVEKKASYANILSRSMAVAQGPLGSQMLDKVFTTTSHTINTGWGYVPYMATQSSGGLVLNGGECVGEVNVVGMGDIIIRAEWTI